MNADQNQPNSVLKDLALTILFSLSAVAVNLILEKYQVQDVNAVLIFLLFTVLTARYTNGYWYGLLSSILAVVFYDYIFVSPRFSFSVFNHVYAMTLLILFFIAMYISAVTSQARTEGIEARTREENANALYQLTAELTTASTKEEIIEKSLHFVSRIFGCKAVYITENPEDKSLSAVTVTGIEGHHELEPVDADIKLQVEDKQDFERFIRGNLYCEWKIEAHNRFFGYLGIPKERVLEMDVLQRNLVAAMTGSISLVLEHFQVLQTQEKDRQEASQERFRSNLLRSISHDLRTPLTGIMGTSELMMKMTDEGSELHILAENIHHEATWLRDLVQNILSLTRLQGGKLHIHKELQIVEEVVDAALQSMRIRYPQRNFLFDPPEDVIAAKMDSKLFQQVLINLMDNANKHSPPGKDIRVEIEEDAAAQNVSVSIIDNGCGLREEIIDKIFAMFYTTRDKEGEATRGFGLGLPICDSIAKAHGGYITAGNNPKEQGAVFTITIPEN